MAHMLPRGLIQQSSAPFTAETPSEEVSLTDLIKLWRVHFSARNALENTVGPRLEQFFWRIIGSPRLQSLSEARISHLYAIISRDDPIHTTPLASPSTAQANLEATPHPVSSENGSSRLPDDSNDPQRGDRLAASDTRIPVGRERSTSRPRPILRMPGVDATASGKSARILTPTWGQNAKGELPPKKSRGSGRGSLLKVQSQESNDIVTPNSESSQQNVPITPLPHGLSTSQSASASSRTGKKGPSFAFPVKKRKPAMPRRTSSQSNSSATDKSPKLTSPPPARVTGSPKSTVSPSYRQSDSRTTRDSSTAMNSPNAGKSKSLPSDMESNNTAEMTAGGWKVPIITTLLTNPQMRNVSTKSTLATGLTLASSTGSLKPFADEDEPPTISRRASANEEDIISGQIEDQETGPLLRSRSALNLLLQKDRRLISEDVRSRKR